MRRIRFMSLLFLVLSAAFFLLPEFRQGLKTPLFPALGSNPGWIELSPQRLQRIAQEAEQRNDAQALAFAATHTANVDERHRLAQRAISIDPTLTWILWKSGGTDLTDPHWPEREARLASWDPDNAVVHLMAAEKAAARTNLRRLPWNDIKPFAGEMAWRQAMEKVFAAPRFDSYLQRRFENDRAVWRRHSLDDPLQVAAWVARVPVPDLSLVRHYGTLLVHLGREAEQAGRRPEALANYWKVAHFGERLERQGRSTIEQLAGTSLKSTAYEALVPALRADGRATEAQSLEHAIELNRIHQDAASGRDPLAQNSNYHWSVLMVHLFVGLVVFFAAITVATMGYAAASHWIGADAQSPLHRLLMAAQNYAPVLLFFACIGLYTSYYPYALNFRHYMSASGPIHDFEPLLHNVVPAFGAIPGQRQLPIESPLQRYAISAFVGIVLLAAVSFLSSRKSPDRAQAASAAG